MAALLRGGSLLRNAGQGGIFVSNGSQLTISDTPIDGSVTQGLFAFGAGSRVTMTGGSIVNTRRDGANQNGFGVNAQQGAVITCTGVALGGNAGGNAFTTTGGTASGCN